MADTRVTIAGVEWKNPVTTASGTFGSGTEFSEFVDLNHLGAVTTKGVANVPWEGNPTPRVAEVYGGMMNAVGLQNPGIDVFCERDIPFLRKYDTKIIVNVCGRSEEDYCEVVERLASEDVDMLEINISCPNVKEGGIAFGQNPKAAETITRAVKKYAKQPVIMKLSPNVTDITEMARAVEAGGADAVSLINTLTGMKIDINRKQFVLANKTGGVSGPVVKPIAVRMVYQVANTVKIPIIGMGGISTWEDAVEFLLAGASAVSVGTANFYNPKATEEIADGIAAYMDRNGYAAVPEMVGIVKYRCVGVKESKTRGVPSRCASFSKLRRVGGTDDDRFRTKAQLRESISGDSPGKSGSSVLRVSGKDGEVQYSGIYGKSRKRETADFKRAVCGNWKQFLHSGTVSCDVGRPACPPWKKRIYQF